MFDPPCGVFLWAFYESYAFVWGAGVYLLHAGKGALRAELVGACRRQNSSYQLVDTEIGEGSDRSDDSWYVRSLATEMLLELGPRGSSDSQPVLVKALHSLDSEVRRTSAITLGKHGEVASHHAAALCTRMLANRPGVKSDDPDADLSEKIEVKTACMWALGQLDPESVVPLIHNLDDGLFHRNTEYRLAATEALTRLGPKAVALRKAGGGSRFSWWSWGAQCGWIFFGIIMIQLWKLWLDFC
ncbi:unnamed protein product [Cladocopium goreaui]|uniref:HEAT repeat domain-containing protein n=1 Tax=Cladocopium goreaui TaxID=2562237 RepID=A0A9P1GBA0_9DINO|nr:unnamed protein product [Cladocopium goreaui]